MRRIVSLCGILVLSQITGCASLSTSPGTSNDEIDRWLDQREYGKALAVVAKAKGSSSPEIRDLQGTQERIDAHIASYERDVIARAESAAAMGDWGSAFESYRDALSRLPESTPLRQGEQQLAQRHAAYVEMLELDRLIAQGEWMLKDLEISKLAEAKNQNNWFGPFTLNRKIERANELARDLADHGRRALDQRDLTVAKRVLPLALNLSRAIEIETLNTRLQEMLKDEELRVLTEHKRITGDEPVAPKAPEERREKKQPSATSGKEPKDATLVMADFRKACREKNFVEAQRLRSKLQKQGVDDQEFVLLSTELASDVARHVKHLIKIGVVHYSRQQYEQALDAWKQAHVLDPKNEQLNARIKRVTRVIKNLQNLRAKSGATQ